MGWIGSSTCVEYANGDAVWQDFHNTLECDVPRRVGDVNKLVDIGTFATKKEAESAIKKANVTGLAYAKYGKPSKAVLDAKKLLDKEKEKLKHARIETSVYNAKTSKTIGCTSCGSSFPRDYFKFYGDGFHSGYLYEEDDDRIKDGNYTYVNNCPICGADMRSDTSRTRINGYLRNIDKYRTRYNDLSKAVYTYIGLPNFYCG